MEQKKSVGAALGVGVLFLPVIFVWAVLFGDYRGKDKAAATVWLLLSLAFAFPYLSQLRILDTPTYATPTMAQITTRAAEDAERQYEIVKNHDVGVMELCMRANSVAESWLQANDEAKYASWKQRAGYLCKVAGVSQ